ncbi:MAG: DUF4340 domain-containing protein [Deltaproteobacteria bacterium]|nr:DUF4340 domain-containing protein [Deltaproteobacteria bacterium]
MSLKKTLVLAIFLVGIISYIQYVELPSQRAEEQKGILFKEISKSDIAQIDIKNSSDTIHLTKDSDWRVETPGSDLVDLGAVDSLLGSIMNLDVSTSIPKEEIEADLSIYGLEKPEASITVSAKGKATEIAFGKLNSFLDKRYIQYGDTRNVSLVTDQLYSAVTKSKDDYRDRTPIEFSAQDIRQILILADNVEYVFVRDSDSSWRSVKPTEATLSEAAVNELLRNVKNLTAAAFIDPKDASSTLNPKDYGIGDKSYVTMNLALGSSEEEKQLKLNIGKKKKDNHEFFYTFDNQRSIFALASDPKPQLVKPVVELREKQLFRFSTDNAVKVSFVYKEELPELTLDKSAKPAESIWLVNHKIADDVFVNEILKNLSNLTADSFPKSQDDLGFDPPTLAVTVTIREDKDTVSEKVLLIGKSIDKTKEEKRYYAIVKGTNEPFIISEQSFKRIRAREETLVKPQDKSENDTNS